VGPARVDTGSERTRIAAGETARSLGPAASEPGPLLGPYDKGSAEAVYASELRFACLRLAPGLVSRENVASYSLPWSLIGMDMLSNASALCDFPERLVYLRPVRRRASRQQHRAIRVPASGLEVGRPAIRAALPGGETCLLAVDSGVPRSWLSRRPRRASGAPEAKRVGAGGAATVLARVSVSGRALAGGRPIEFDLRPLGPSGARRTIVGALGMDVLGGYAVTIDRSTSSVTFAQGYSAPSGKLATRAPLFYCGTVYAVVAQIGAASALMVVQTADPDSAVLTDRVLKAAPATAAYRSRRTNAPIGFRVREFSVGQWRLRRTAFWFQRMPGTGYDGQLGTDAFGPNVVTYDFPGRTMYLRRPTRPVAPRSDCFGVGIIALPKRGVALVVDDVVCRSPAAKAGIMPGDALISVGGVDATTANGARLDARLRARPGTRLRVVIRRRGEPRPREVVVVVSGP
jgi:hypothetical protein